MRGRDWCEREGTGVRGRGLVWEGGDWCEREGTGV